MHPRENPRWATPRSPTSAAILVDFALERGMSRDAILAGTSLDEAALRDPHAEIGSWQELTVVENLTRALGNDPVLGMEVGTRYHITSQGIWGLAILGAKSVRESLTLGLRYLDLTAVFTSMSMKEDAGEARVVIEDSHLPLNVRTFLLHRDASALHTLRVDMIGRTALTPRLYMKQPIAGIDAAYVARIGVVPAPSPAGENASVFDARILDLPLPTANEHAVKLAEEYCRRVRSQRSARRGVTGFVSARLMQNGGTMSMDEMARALGMTSRTLRRKLAAEGTTYRDVAEQTRLALAEELVADGLPQAEVAARLGYADLSSFLHSFKRMTGMTPSRYFAPRDSDGESGH